MNLLAFQDVSKSFGGGSFEEFFRNFRVRSRKFKRFPEVCQGVSSRFKTFQLIFGGVVSRMSQEILSEIWPIICLKIPSRILSEYLPRIYLEIFIRNLFTNSFRDFFRKISSDCFRNSNNNSLKKSFIPPEISPCFFSFKNNFINFNKYSSRDSFKHLSGLISGNSSDSTILCFVIHEFSQHLSHYSISRSRCTVGFQSLLKLPPGSTAKCVGRSIITALHVLQLVPVAVFSGDGCAF